MDDNLVRGRQHFNLRDVGNIRYAQRVVDTQVLDIDFDAFRDVSGQTLDFDFTNDELENAGIDLHAARFALRCDRHRDADRHVHRDAIEVRVQEVFADGIDLPALQNGVCRAFTADIQLQDCVAAGFRTQHFLKRFRINGDSHGVAFAAIYDGGNQALTPNTPCSILASFVAGLRSNRNFSHR